MKATAANTVYALGEWCVTCVVSRVVRWLACCVNAQVCWEAFSNMHAHAHMRDLCECQSHTLPTHMPTQPLPAVQV